MDIQSLLGDESDSLLTHVAKGITKDELTGSFGKGSGWRVAAVEEDRLQTRFHGDHGAPAWCATIKRA